MDLLYKLAEQQGVMGLAKKMFAGETINEAEGRAVLHMALRNQSKKPIIVDGKDVMLEANDTLAKTKTFSDDVRWADGQTYQEHHQHRHRRVRPRPRHGARRAQAAREARSRHAFLLERRRDTYC